MLRTVTQIHQEYSNLFAIGRKFRAAVYVTT